MLEFLQNVLRQIREIWSKWSSLQRIIFISVVLILVATPIVIISFSASPSLFPVLTQGVTDEVLRQRIGARLDSEGIEYSVSGDFVFSVRSIEDARRARAILATEDLLPGNVDPWALFDMDRWTITDYEREVNLRRSITEQLTQHIEALEDVDSASITIVFQDPDILFTEDQYPVSASVVLTPKPGSDLVENRRKLEGIQELVQFAVPGLLAEYITIADTSGRTLNDFADFTELDRLEINRRELRLKRELETQYIRAIENALAGIFTPERIEIANIEVDLDFGNREIEREEFFPIETVPDNPATPFSEREVVLNILRSNEEFNENFEGTGGFNPQGPPGVEGQTPPSYQDLEGVIGSYDRTQNINNFEVNRTLTRESGTPSINRISVGVAIDGIWRQQRDERGNILFEADTSISRVYTPVSELELQQASELIQAAVGYDAARGDIVNVRSLQFDRVSEHEAEDALLWRQDRTRRTIPIVSISAISFLVLLLILRLIFKEIDRRRRLREEELAQQYQALRDEALRNAEEDEGNVEMSVEERARLELHEDAFALARERPEEVANLIRTWLVEE